MAEYNGWTKNVALWLDKEEGTQEYWHGEATECFGNAEADDTFTRLQNASFDLRDRIKGEIEDQNPLIGEATMWNYLLGAALSEVNWQEIAENLLSAIAEDKAATSE